MIAFRRWPGIVLAALMTLACATPARADSLATWLAQERARRVAPMLPRDAFVSQPTLASPTIAPDGRTVAWLRIVGGRYSLWDQATTPGATPRRLLARADAREIAWSADSRWIVMFAPNDIRLLSMTGSPGSGRIAELGGPTEVRLLALDPWRPGVLLIDHVGPRWRLWRAGPGGARRLIAYADHELIDVAIGRDGRVAFAKLLDGDGHRVAARAGDGRFVTVSRCVRLQRCDLIGVTPDGRSAWLAGDDMGGRRAIQQLYRDGRRTLVHADPAGAVDIDAIVIDRASGVPVIAGYRGDTPALYGLTAETRAGLARLDLSGEATVETSAGSWLIRERDARLQGFRWHLFDPARGAARLVLDDRPQRLLPERLACVLPFPYRASDGMMLHGFLSVPHGRDPARVPLVTIVHGGPWSHDDTDYSATTQLLVNRGYAVFRPQFRGSTGYGRGYMLAARGDFGDGRVQRDIEEGTRAVLARGIGDPRRSAIMGASFGGYATLQALSNGSNLYSVGIAIVPPVDFGWTSRYAVVRSDLGRTQGIDFTQSLRLLDLAADDPAIARRLYLQSPRAHVAAMRTPLLILASGRDERVPIRSVIDYAAALRVAKAPARIIVARNQPHAPDDPMAIRASLYLTEAMLAKHLNGPKPAPPAGALRQWLSSNLDER